MTRFLSKSERPVPRWPLWSLLWRIIGIIVFGPILWTTGLVAILTLSVSILGPPIYFVILLLEARYIVAVLVLLAWWFWLPWARRLWRWMMQGEEYGSL